MSDVMISTPESAQLDCPECKASITYYDVKGSEYYACPHCHAYFQYSGEEKPKLFGKYNEAPSQSPVIPLGAVGVLLGRRYRMVGVVERREVKYPQYRWREYQLFDLEGGAYAQLAEFNGHWTLVRPASTDDPDEGSYALTNFKLFNRYQARVNWASGEFDWNIENDTSLNVSEYIRPPLLLVKEQRGNQQHWYRGRHLEPSEVATAFRLSSDALPYREGVGAVQPAPGRDSSAALSRVTTWAVCLLVLVQLALFFRTSKPLLSETLRVEADAAAAPGTGRVMVSPSFTLDHQTALEIDLIATVDNQWLELPVSLVNEQTGQGFEFTKNIEFYRGVEGGESWSEGSRNADAVLSRVPEGRYHLNFYPITEPGVSPEIRVTVWADPSLPSNFWVVLALILAYPVLQFFRWYSHDRSRWENSDFNPYATE